MDLTPVLYQYGIGLLVMLGGLWAGARTGVWGRGKWRWAVVMVAGWLLLFAVQLGLQIWAGQR